MGFAVVAGVARVRDPATATRTTVVLAGLLAILALVVVAGALPVVRARAHHVFELTHRFAGWMAVGLFWPLTIHLALQGRGTESAAHAILTDWHVWVVAAVTASVASPWLRRRRVPVTVETPSGHAAIVCSCGGRTARSTPRRCSWCPTRRRPSSSARRSRRRGSRRSGRSGTPDGAPESHAVRAAHEVAPRARRRERDGRWTSHRSRPGTGSGTFAAARGGAWIRNARAPTGWRAFAGASCVH